MLNVSNLRVRLLWCWAETQFTDTGLQPFTLYEYRVESNNSLGTALSPAVVFRSGAAAPSGNFTARVELTQSRSVSLSWSAPSSPNGVIERYEVSFFNRSSNAYVKRDVGSSLSTRVTGLRPYSRYNFTVSACTSAGCFDTSVTAITGQAPPDGQLPPNVSAVGSTALYVTWQPPTQPNGRTRAARFLSVTVDFCLSVAWLQNPHPQQH